MTMNTTESMGGSDTGEEDVEDSLLVISQRETTLLTIKEAAINEMETRYNQNSYHNKAHALLVQSEATKLSNMVRIEISTVEQQITELAAAAHDVRLDKNPRDSDYNGQNERAAAAWLRKKMEATGIFPEEEIQLAEKAIWATYTKPLPLPDKSGEWPEETRLHQNQMRLEENPPHLVSQILCDADLASLGLEWSIYWTNMTGFYYELNPDGGTPENWRKYLVMQTRILQHKYYTEAARERYEDNLSSNQMRVKHMIDKELEESFTLIKKHAPKNVH
jgi:hypothetical protein